MTSADMFLNVQDLDVEDEGLQCPPSPLQFDTALALEDQTIREIAEAPMDILTGEEEGFEAQDAEFSERDEDQVFLLLSFAGINSNTFTIISATVQICSGK